MITETVTGSQMLDLMDDVDGAREEVTVRMANGTEAHFDSAYLYNGRVSVAVWWANPHNAECPFTHTLTQDSYTVTYEG